MSKSIKRILIRFCLTCFLLIPIAVSSYVRLHQTNKPKIAVITNCAVDFWTIVGLGAKAAEKDFNVDVEFRMPAFPSAADQHRIVEDSLAKGVQGIAISPINAANQTAVFNHIVPENVYLIAQDGDFNKESKRKCYIGTDNAKAGWRAGTLVREVLPAGAKVVIYSSTVDQLNLQERRQGVIAGLAGLKEAESKSNLAHDLSLRPYPVSLGRYTLIATMTDYADKEKCYANVVDTLIKHPDVNCLVGLCCHNPPAMMLGVQKRKKEGQIKLIGFDEDDLTLKGIKDGAIYGTVVQNPYMFGYESVHILDHCIQTKGSLPDEMPRSAKRQNLSDGPHYFVSPRVIKKADDGKLFDLDVDTFAADLKQKKG